jgi:hypothetical protein
VVTRNIPLKTGHIEALPNNKPAVYTAGNAGDPNLYVGVAKRGRVQERLMEHLNGAKDPIPGATRVKVEYKSSIAEAKAVEARRIAATQPKHNKQGKK